MSDSERNFAAFYNFDWPSIAKHIRVEDKTITRMIETCEGKIRNPAGDSWCTVSPNWLIAVLCEVAEHRGLKEAAKNMASSDPLPSQLQLNGELVKPVA
jgi:hypothetical protein